MENCISGLLKARIFSAREESLDTLRNGAEFILS